jgi:IclR family KDG regulon transcriptional repressor
MHDSLFVNMNLDVDAASPDEASGGSGARRRAGRLSAMPGTSRAAEGLAADTSAGGPGLVKSADRLMTVLEFLAEVRQATFSEVAAALSLPNSSAHQLLQTMARRGFLRLDPHTHRYRLGGRIWEIAHAYSDDADLITTAQPVMDRLRDQTMETVQLARLEGIENVYLAISESRHPMKLVSAVGMRLFAHATGLGKALLAGLTDEEARRRLAAVPLPRLTPNTITDPELLVRELAHIRQTGYATDREEYAIGCRCIAMPIHDSTGSVCAAMSVSVPTPRYDEAVERNVIDALADAVAAISTRSGYTSSRPSPKGTARGSGPEPTRAG